MADLHQLINRVITGPALPPLQQGSCCSPGITGVELGVLQLRSQAQEVAHRGIGDPEVLRGTLGIPGVGWCLLDLQGMNPGDRPDLVLPGKILPPDILLKLKALGFGLGEVLPEPGVDLAPAKGLCCSESP